VLKKAIDTPNIVRDGCITLIPPVEKLRQAAAIRTERPAWFTIGMASI